MAIRSTRTIGRGSRSTASLNRSGVGDVQTAMNVSPGQKDIFGGVQSAFSINDLRKAMRRGPTSGIGNRANWDKRQQMSRAKEMMAFQQKLRSTASDQQRRKILELATQQGGDAKIPGIQPRGAAATQFGMTQIAPYMSSLFGGEAGARAVGSSKAGGMIGGQPEATPEGGGLQMGPNEMRAMVQQMIAQGQDPSSVLGSREEGGGIPKTGIYQLHEGEQVVPAPEKLQEMVMDMIVDRQMGDSVGSKTRKKRGKKGKKKKGYEEGTITSYEDGTDGSMEALMQMLGLYEDKPAPSPEGQFGETESGLPYMTGQLDPNAAGQEADVMDMLRGVPNVPGMPSPMTEGSARPETTEENMLREGMQIRQDVANPEIHPQEALDTVAKERERMAPEPGSQPSPFGPEAGYEGELTEGVGEAGERSFTLKGSEYTLEKRLADRYDRDSAEIERMNDGAESHARYAAQLLEYASERPHSGANERLRQMAGDRMKLAKEMQASASGRQKSLDLMVESQGEQQAEKEAAGIEARGRVGSAQVGAQGRVAAAQARAQGGGDVMDSLTDLLDSYAGMEDADPEAREAALQQMITLFTQALMTESRSFQGARPGGV